jgi:hypothetical protein
MLRHVHFLLVAAVSLILVSGSSSIALAADDDCPPGSFQKSEDGFTWCQPTVCANDGQCKPNEVCRSIALCMEVGSLADAGAVAAADAGNKRLAVTQRCAADQVCPQKQTCSKLDRCVSKATAEKMGILAASSSSPAPAGSTEPAKKSSCGCRVVGSSSSSPLFAIGFGVFATMVAMRRRGRRAVDPT